MRLNFPSIVDDSLALLVIFEAIVLGQVAVYPYSIYTIGSLAWYETRILASLVAFTPLLLAVLLYAWLGVLIVKYAWNHSKVFSGFIHPLLLIVRGPIRRDPSKEEFVILRHPRIMLIVGMTVVAMLCTLPYLPGLNPNGTPVGIDTPTYIQWTSQMLARPLPQAISFAFGQADNGFRPIPLLLFYAIASLGVRPDLVVEFSPVVLAPLLCLSSYLFVKAGSGDRELAALTALASAFSFEVTVGIWAGFLANWLAMIFAYFLLAGFLLLQKSRRKAILPLLTLLSLALLMSHPWTWALIIATTLVYALTGSRDKRVFSTLSIVCLIVAGISVDLAKSQLAGSTTLAEDLGTKGPVFGISQFLMFWPNLWGTLVVFYNGILGNALLLGLAAFPFIFIKFQNKMQGLVRSWVASASAPFLVLNSFHQTRLLYDLPISPLVAMAVLFIMSRAGGGNLRASLILLAILLLSANYAVRSVIQA